MIKLIADSSCYLPPELIARYQTEIVPLKINFGGQVFDELTGISNQAFYRRLTTEVIFPTTSQPPVGEFLAAYKKSEPEDELLVITLSGKFSGTVNVAQMAASLLPHRAITVFDSQSIGLGIGLMIATAADMIAAGSSVAQIVAALDQMRRSFRIFFILDDLEHLRRGGRIGAVSTAVGSLLKIKPILTLEDGLLRPLDKVRTRRRAMERLLEEIKAAVPDPATPVVLGAMHVAAEADMQALIGQAAARFSNVQRVLTGEVGPALGVHGGPGILGVGVCPYPQVETLPFVIPAHPSDRACV